MERIFYKTDVVDPILNVPIYIFDTSFLPSPDDINYDEFIPTLLMMLPSSPYVLIMFSCGLNKINWVYGIKFFKLFVANNYKENVLKLITVHDSWFLKSFNQVLLNYYSTIKFNKIIDMATSNIISLINLYRNNSQSLITCDSLSSLSNYLDLTKLKISLNVYKHDLQVKPLTLSMRYSPLINPLTKVDVKTNPLFYHHFYQLFNIIDANSNKTPMVFHKPGNKASTDILFNCIQRNQLFWINDWDFFCITSVFKRITTELPYPIIPTDLIKIPMSDDFEYTESTFANIVQYHKSTGFNYDQLLYQFFTLFAKTLTGDTEHTSTTLAKSMGYCLSHEIISSKNDKIFVVNRFIKNTIDSWSKIAKLYSYPTLEEAIYGKSNVDDLYYHHDITIDEFNCDDSSNSSKTDLTNESDSLVLAGHFDNTSITRSFSSSTQKGSNANEIVSELTTSVDLIDFDSPVETQPSNEIEDRELNTKDVPQSQVMKDPKVSKASNKSTKLADISNITFQNPPHRYKVPPNLKKKLPPPEVPAKSTQLPVIRGRKVRELAKLFEDRAEAYDILRGM